MKMAFIYYYFFFQAEDGIRDVAVTGVQTCALPISPETSDKLHSLKKVGRSRDEFPLPSRAGREFRLFLVCRRPAHARGNGRPIVFALDHVLRAAIVEAEDLVIDIEAIHEIGRAHV